MRPAFIVLLRLAAPVVLGSLLLAQSTTLVSQDDSGAAAQANCGWGSISADGRYVAFQSDASLVLPDTNFHSDVFVRDMEAGAIRRVSVSSAGIQGNDQSSIPVISANGRYVAFTSTSTNLVAEDTNGYLDVFVHDLVTGTTVLASADDTGQPVFAGGFSPSISADGRYVAFLSHSPDLSPPDANGLARDVFVRDLQNGTTTLVSVNSSGEQANAESGSSLFQGHAISGDGRFVAFHSAATNLVVPDANGSTWDVFLRDLQTGTTTLVGQSSSGIQGNQGSYIQSTSAVSEDGRYVAFDSGSTNLVTPDTNGTTSDVFVRDVQAGTTILVSRSTTGVQGNGDSYIASITPDGRFVAFWSHAYNLVPGDTSGAEDALLRDLQFGTTEIVGLTHASTQADSSAGTSISANGRYAVFTSRANNLPGTNFGSQVFVRDRQIFVPVAHCFGDGSGGSCPCGNAGAPGRGCQNSASTGGAVLTASGIPSLNADTLHLTSSGELGSSLSIFLQGTQTIAPVIFGDGLRCIGGTLKRLYVRSASGGVATAPDGGGTPVSERSAMLGNPIPINGTRHYQTYYRDPFTPFCPTPPGSTFNASNALTIDWNL